MLRDYIEAFRVAVGFLTVIPVGEARVSPPHEMERAFSLFPLVGLGMGIDFTILGWLDSKVASPLVAASLVLVFWVLVTGGLHLDGVADSFDALALGKGREDRLRIMKESTVGTFGVLAVVLLMILKMSALVTILERGVWRGILVAPVVARWAVVLLSHVSTPAREGGLGIMAVHASTRKVLSISSLLMVAILLFVWPLGVLNLVWVVPFAFGVSAFWRERLGGITGDVLGATVELVEVGVLLLASVLC